MSAPIDGDHGECDIIDMLIGMEARDERFAPFWTRVVAADRRLARIRDNPEWRAEIDAMLASWQKALSDPLWYPERSKRDLDALSERVLQVQEELCELANEASAVGRVTAGGPLDDHVGALLLHIGDALDALAPAADAAKHIAATPAKRGGRGKYTSGLRPTPIEEFGKGVVQIFRAAGLSLGGNADRDRAFELFIEIAANVVTGARIPGKGALLAALRKL